MPVVAVNVTVVPALATPLVTVVPLIFSVGVEKTSPVQLTACHVKPVLAPVSTMLTVLPVKLGDAGKVINPEAADVGAALALRAMFQVAEDGTAVVKASLPASTVVMPE